MDMALNYETCARQIYETLGGRENLVSAAGYPPTVAVLLTNSDDYKALRVEKTGKTKQTERIFSVEEG